MKDFGIVESAVRPEPLVIDEFSVWINTNIQEITKPAMEDGEVEQGFQFHMIQYPKDEYIRMIAEQNTTLDAQMTDLQMARCDVYEMMG